MSIKSPYLTIEELADVLRCRPITVSRRIRDGVWPSSMVAGKRLFNPEQVAEIMRLCEQPVRDQPTRTRRRAS